MPKTPDRAAAIVKHSVLIAGHSTSVSLEDIFWSALRAEAAKRGSSVAALIAEIDAGRGAANLSSAIRVHLFSRAYFAGGALTENAGDGGASK